jgi:hypothetical protein
LRHKNPASCPVGAIAFHLFYRFSIDKEPMFSMDNNESWYNVYLLQGSSPEKPQSYSLQHSDTKGAIADIGIITSKVRINFVHHDL